MEVLLIELLTKAKESEVNMVVKVYSETTGELVFTYTEDLEPEVMDCGHYFDVYYLWDPKDRNSESVCTYKASDYYYKVEGR